MFPGQGVHIHAWGGEMQSEVCYSLHSVQNLAGFWGIYLGTQVDVSTAQDRPALPREIADKILGPV